MRAHEPFQPDDLAELDERVLARALRVVPLIDVWRSSNPHQELIALRHDVDNVLEPAVALAAWESARGYRSTYFILHTAPYWPNESKLREGLEQISLLGHEIGIHTNALAQALRTGRDPDEILHGAIERLRGWGFGIKGVAGHGDNLCYFAGRQKVEFANDEHFIECARPEHGEPERMVRRGSKRLYIRPRPLADFGLLYEALRLPRALYLSDSGGQWRPDGVASFEQIVSDFPSPNGPLQFLMHPDWWGEAVEM